ncbi:MAG: hypothetical protein AB1635_02680 [Acidobacteriota bacterium]
MRTVTSRGTALVLLALAGAACDATINPFPITQPSPVPITVQFTGSLTRNGGATHQFDSTGPGTVQATLVSLAPDGDAIVGFGLGTWNGQLCSMVLAKDDARVNTVITGSAGSAGPLCVRVWDNNLLGEETTYEITVVHP